MKHVLYYLIISSFVLCSSMNKKKERKRLEGGVKYLHLYIKHRGEKKRYITSSVGIRSIHRVWSKLVFNDSERCRRRGEEKQEATARAAARRACRSRLVSN